MAMFSLDFYQEKHNIQIQCLTKLYHHKTFTHPQVVLNLYEFLSFAEHKGRHFEEVWVTKHLMAPTDFHSLEKKASNSKLPPFRAPSIAMPPTKIYERAQSLQVPQETHNLMSQSRA